MDDPKSFPERLGALLAESGARHAQVARWMDVDRVSVTQWLAGRSEPRGGLVAIDRLAKFFGAAPEWLGFGRGKRPSKTAVTAAVHEAIAEMGRWPIAAEEPAVSDGPVVDRDPAFSQIAPESP